MSNTITDREWRLWKPIIHQSYCRLEETLSQNSSGLSSVILKLWLWMLIIHHSYWAFFLRCMKHNHLNKLHFRRNSPNFFSQKGLRLPLHIKSIKTFSTPLKTFFVYLWPKVNLQCSNMLLLEQLTWVSFLLLSWFYDTLFTLLWPGAYLPYTMEIGVQSFSIRFLFCLHVVTTTFMHNW